MSPAPVISRLQRLRTAGAGDLAGLIVLALAPRPAADRLVERPPLLSSTSPPASPSWPSSHRASISSSAIGGLISFGHAAFIGIGAYCVGIPAYYDLNSGLLHFPLAIAVSALFALLTGAVCLRTRGVYFIMITMAFAQMAYYFFQSLDEYGGDDGLTIYTRSGLPGLDLDHRPQLFLLAYVSLHRRARISRTAWSIRASAWCCKGAKANETRMIAHRLQHLCLPSRRLCDRRGDGRLRRGAAGRFHQFHHPRHDGLDALGRPHVHGDPGWRRHPVRPGHGGRRHSGAGGISRPAARLARRSCPRARDVSQHRARLAASFRAPPDRHGAVSARRPHRPLRASREAADERTAARGHGPCQELRRRARHRRGGPERRLIAKCMRSSAPTAPARPP